MDTKLEVTLVSVSIVALILVSLFAVRLQGLSTEIIVFWTFLALMVGGYAMSKLKPKKFVNKIEKL